jgi:hypothetical protein
MIVGGIGGGNGRLSILHPQEMVLPAQISRGIQSMITNGNISNTGGNSMSHTANLNFSPTVNTGGKGQGRGGGNMSRSDFVQTMSLHSASMLAEARNMMKSGWRPYL